MVYNLYRGVFMANKKYKKRKTEISVFKKLLIVLLVLGMIGMYVIMPIMSMGA